MSSFWKAHKERWSGGCGADICSRSSNRVLYRGKIPCDILFVGEAPGESEDAIGSPLTGPSGHLLDAVIADARAEVPGGNEVRVGFTNMVGCMPRDEYHNKCGQPNNEAVMQCRGRLDECLSMSAPKAVVCVGRFAEGYFTKDGKAKVRLPEGVMVRSIPHPSFALQMGGSKKDASRQEDVILHMTIVVRDLMALIVRRSGS